jgi:hypothetical protein
VPEKVVIPSFDAADLPKDRRSRSGVAHLLRSHSR